MAELDDNEYRRVRVEKRDRLREAGVNPYPESFDGHPNPHGYKVMAESLWESLQPNSAGHESGS